MYKKWNCKHWYIILFDRYIEKIFTQLEEFRAFELLRSGLDRSKYLLVKEAKVIAMTCTHAALKRKELVDLGEKHSTLCIRSLHYRFIMLSLLIEFDKTHIKYIIVRQ